MKKIIATLAIASALMLTACGSSTSAYVSSSNDNTAPADKGRGGWFSEEHIKLSNGRTVTCLVGSNGAISCDWNTTK